MNMYNVPLYSKYDLPNGVRQSRNNIYALLVVMQKRVKNCSGINNARVTMVEWNQWRNLQNLILTRNFQLLKAAYITYHFNAYAWTQLAASQTWAENKMQKFDRPQNRAISGSSH